MAQPLTYHSLKQTLSAAVQDGTLPEFIDRLRQLVRRNPSFYFGWLFLARASDRRDDVKSAENYYLQAVAVASPTTIHLLIEHDLIPFAVTRGRDHPLREAQRRTGVNQPWPSASTQSATQQSGDSIPFVVESDRQNTLTDPLPVVAAPQPQSEQSSPPPMATGVPVPTVVVEAVRPLEFGSRTAPLEVPQPPPAHEPNGDQGRDILLEQEEAASREGFFDPVWDFYDEKSDNSSGEPEARTLSQTQFAIVQDGRTETAPPDSLSSGAHAEHQSPPCGLTPDLVLSLGPPRFHDDGNHTSSGVIVQNTGPAPVSDIRESARIKTSAVNETSREGELVTEQEVADNDFRSLPIDVPKSKLKADLETPHVLQPGASPDSPSKKVGKVPRNEANVRVREYLAKNPKASIREVGVATGLAQSSIANTEAWKAVQKVRNEQRATRSPSPKEPRQLTDQMLETRGQGDRDDVLETVERRETAERRILEDASDEERANFYRMDKDKKEQMIQTVLASMDEEEREQRQYRSRRR
jgi:hypothetical protein